MREVFGIIMAGIVFYATISFIWYIIMVIANWKIFTKAGESGWMSIIPFLNSYILFKISWKKIMFWAMLGALLLGSIFTGLAGEEGGILEVLGMIFTLIGGVISIIDVYKLSKSFGYGIWFTIGLLFFSPLFTLILGYGKAEYIGPEGISAQSSMPY